MLHIELKPENNNKDFYEIRSLLHCNKIKFKPQKHDQKYLNAASITNDTAIWEISASIKRDVSNLYYMQTPTIHINSNCLRDNLRMLNAMRKQLSNKLQRLYSL